MIQNYKNLFVIRLTIIYIYIEEKLKDLNERLNDGIIIANNFKALSELLKNCKTKEQVDLVYQWGSENYQTGYYFNKQVENFRESASYLKKVEEINDGCENKLIIGDNYDALNNLIAAGYKNKIDIIYIDPPYGMDNERKFAETNYENKIDRDSLLSMLQPRLELAKELLSNEGLFFCSIDDRNYAYVKVLCDTIFGCNKFVNTIIWQRHSGGGLTKKIITGHDYVLVYRMNKTTMLYAKQDIDKNKVKIINDKEYYFDANPLKKEFGNKRIPSGLDRYLVFEELSKEKQNEYKKSELFLIKEYKNTGKHIIYPYRRADVKKMYSINGCESGAGIENLIELGFKKEDFDFPKPVQLMKTLLFSNYKKDSIILDFFAGSGTTGQAVLELNKEDNGNRKFILCVNNSGNSDEICKERLRRVMTGKTKDGKSNFPWSKDNEPLGSSLGVYDIKEASKYTDANCLIDQIDERDYDLPKFKTEIEKIEWVCDNFKVCTRGLRKP